MKILSEVFNCYLKCIKIPLQDAETIFQCFESDLPSPGSFMLELQRWKVYWSGDTNPPSTLTDTLASPHYSTKSYPNITHILSVTSVTSATTERANSSPVYKE